MKSIKINAAFFPIFIAVIIAAFYNIPFWHAILHTHNVKEPLSLISIFLLLTSIFSILFSLINFPFLSKIFVSLTLLINSFLLYFINAFGIKIDKGVILSIISTNFSEATAWLSPALMLYVTFLGILPIIFLYKKIKIVYPNFIKNICINLGVVLSSLAFIWVILSINLREPLFNLKQINSLPHVLVPNETSNRLHHLKFLLLPTSYLDAPRIILNDLKSKGPMKEITDIVLMDKTRKNRTITVFVLGESARSKNFSLNGYSRNTNPELSKVDPISFNNFYSCNTLTIESIPCIFSHQPRAEFDRHSAYSHENLIDVLVKSNMQVLWKTNNGFYDTKRKKVIYEELSGSTNKYDEKLLEKLNDFITSKPDHDLFIVLHQHGSHGPAYTQDYPKNFESFTPTCSKGNVIKDCSLTSITNAYDNSILYTDYFLSKVVGFLKEAPQYNTAMVYVSDHGESLGENGIFMHCAPYNIAPIEQKHIPFILWFSDSFKKDFKINDQCLRGNIGKEYSHDNIFHSMLGLFGIQTEFYKKDYDMFAECRTK